MSLEIPKHPDLIDEHIALKTIQDLFDETHDMPKKHFNPRFGFPGFEGTRSLIRGVHEYHVPETVITREVVALLPHNWERTAEYVIFIRRDQSLVTSTIEQLDVFAITIPSIEKPATLESTDLFQTMMHNIVTTFDENEMWDEQCKTTPYHALRTIEDQWTAMNNESTGMRDSDNDLIAD